MWFLVFVVGSIGLYAGQVPTPKAAEPLVQELSTKAIKAKMSKSNTKDRALLELALGASYIKDDKWKDAYNAFTRASKIKYLERHVKYFKAISAVNAFEDETHIKDALNDLYYLDGRGGPTSEDLEQYESKAEFKLAMIKARAGDYPSALDFLSRARKNNYSNLESEFALTKLFGGWDKKLSQEFMLDLYKRFGDKTKPYFDKLSDKERATLNEAIGGISVKAQQEMTKTQQQTQQSDMLNAIGVAVDNKNYSEYKGLAEEFLRKYGKPPYSKKFYSTYAGFMEDAIFNKKYSASSFDDVLTYCDREYIEKLALKLWQRSDWKNTEHLLRSLSKKFPLYDKALFLLGSFYEDIDKNSKAQDYYKNIIEDFPQSDYYQRALFKYAWLKMLDGDRRTCADVYGRYLAEGGESYDWAITAALYFRSECLSGLSKKEEAIAVKQDLMARYPFSFYALLSMDELNIDVVKTLEDSIKPQTYTEDAVSPSDVYTMNTASYLIRAGLLDWARKELGTINLDKLSSEYLELVSDLYRYANMHDMAFIAAGKLLLNLKGYSSREHAQTHYPKPYMELVDNFSKSTGVEPFVIFAIMKRESAFNKDAVSKAGAQGLMQLMPYTAARFDPSVNDKKLKDAETNIKLASLYLKKLFEKYNGNLVYIAAAYNAGEENLDRWIKWYSSKLSDVEFIENIPYFETRAYVKSVVSNYYMYNALYLKKKISFDDVMRLSLKKGRMNMEAFDVVVIGAGPAGITAGIYIARSGRSCVIVEAGAAGGQVFINHLVENYPGFSEPIKGWELAERMEKQVTRLGVEIKNSSVSSIKKEGNFFIVEGFSLNLKAKVVVYSAGSKPKSLGVPGEEKLFGSGVSYCSTCDGPFFKYKDVVVIGGGNSALHGAEYLEKICKSVTIIHRRDDFRGDIVLVDRLKKATNVNMSMSAEVLEVVGDKKVEAVKIKDVKTGVVKDLKCDGVFIYVGYQPQSELLKGLCKLDDYGYVITDEFMSTNVPGLYAAGDVVKKLHRQIITASYDGCIAALSINGYLNKNS